MFKSHCSASTDSLYLYRSFYIVFIHSFLFLYSCFVYCFYMVALCAFFVQCLFYSFTLYTVVIQQLHTLFFYTKVVFLHCFVYWLCMFLYTCFVRCFVHWLCVLFVNSGFVYCFCTLALFIVYVQWLLVRCNNIVSGQIVFNFILFILLNSIVYI